MQTDTETSMYGQVCVGGAQAVIAAFEVETVVLKQYQGDMTAGYSLIRFYDARTWEKLSTARMNQVINKELAATRRAVCIEQERQAFRANLKPGDFAANGLIVETKPPLALVQGSDVAHSQWLPIANLLPRSTACGRVGP
jgi:hypothetical protein